MLQLGNLAVICAKRSGVALQIMDGKATIFFGDGPQRCQFTVDCWDNARIRELINELNYGSLREEEAYD